MQCIEEILLKQPTREVHGQQKTPQKPNLDSGIRLVVGRRTINDFLHLPRGAVRILAKYYTAALGNTWQSHKRITRCHDALC
jgi:hypothetical protein